MSDEQPTWLDVEILAGTVRLRGEIDLATAPTVRDAVERLLATGTHSVSIDLAGVTFVDSSGLSALVESDRTCRDAGAPLVLARAGPPVLRVLELTGLDDYFELRSASPAA